jgi:ABC-type dipeptide/oligopeptide/nickel transport system ATPase subunit
MREYFDIEIIKNGSSLLKIDRHQIRFGKMNFIFGESGIGKSIAHLGLFGLLDKDRLDIRINGKFYETYLESREFKILRKNGFFVFQEPSTHFDPLKTIRAQLNEGDIFAPEKDYEILEKLWEDKNYLDKLDIFPSTFRPSGGEKQRFMLSMALKKIQLYKRGTYFFDEPTAFLDEESRNFFLNELFRLVNEYKITIVFITHDYSIIKYMETAYFSQKSLFFEWIKNETQVFEEKISYEDIRELFSSKFEAEQSKKNEILRIFPEYQMFSKKFFLRQNSDENTLKIYPGNIYYLRAKSGVGKTTFMKALMGLEQTQKIKFSINGIEFTEKSSIAMWRNFVWGKSLSMAFQHADEVLNAKSTVWESLKFLPIPNVSKDMIEKVAKNFFDRLPKKFLDRKIETFSGGQKQRINLLRTFLADTPIIILDEPFSGLDIKSISIIFNLIQESLKKGKSILLISHSESLLEPVIPESNIIDLEILE